MIHWNRRRLKLNLSSFRFPSLPLLISMIAVLSSSHQAAAAAAKLKERSAFSGCDCNKGGESSERIQSERQYCDFDYAFIGSVETEFTEDLNSISVSAHRGHKYSKKTKNRILRINTSTGRETVPNSYVNIKHQPFSADYATIINGSRRSLLYPYSTTLRNKNDCRLRGPPARKNPFNIAQLSAQRQSFHRNRRIPQQSTTSRFLSAAYGKRRRRRRSKRSSAVLYQRRSPASLSTSVIPSAARNRPPRVFSSFRRRETYSIGGDGGEGGSGSVLFEPFVEPPTEESKGSNRRLQHRSKQKNIIRSIYQMNIVRMLKSDSRLYNPDANYDVELFGLSVDKLCHKALPFEQYMLVIGRFSSDGGNGLKPIVSECHTFFHEINSDFNRYKTMPVCSPSTTAPSTSNTYPMVPPATAAPIFFTSKKSFQSWWTVDGDRVPFYHMMTAAPRRTTTFRTTTTTSTTTTTTIKPCTCSKTTAATAIPRNTPGDYCAFDYAIRGRISAEGEEQEQMNDNDAAGRGSGRKRVVRFHRHRSKRAAARQPAAVGVRRQDWMRRRSGLRRSRRQRRRRQYRKKPKILKRRNFYIMELHQIYKFHPAVYNDVLGGLKSNEAEIFGSFNEKQCDYRLEAGKNYLIFGNLNNQTELSASICDFMAVEIRKNMEYALKNLPKCIVTTTTTTPTTTTTTEPPSKTTDPNDWYHGPFDDYDFSRTSTNSSLSSLMTARLSTNDRSSILRNDRTTDRIAAISNNNKDSTSKIKSRNLTPISDVKSRRPTAAAQPPPPPMIPFLMAPQRILRNCARYRACRSLMERVLLEVTLPSTGHKEDRKARQVAVVNNSDRQDYGPIGSRDPRRITKLPNHYLTATTRRRRQRRQKRRRHGFF